MCWDLYSGIKQCAANLDGAKSARWSKKANMIPSKNLHRLCANNGPLARIFPCVLEKCPNLGAHLPRRKLNNRAQKGGEETNNRLFAAITSRRKWDADGPEGRNLRAALTAAHNGPFIGHSSRYPRRRSESKLISYLRAAETIDPQSFQRGRRASPTE